MELLVGMRTDCEEGNISWFPHRQKTLKEIIENIKPKTIMEIGFNMGHSLTLICETLIGLKQKDPNYGPVRIFVFDICEHECTEHNFYILEEYYKRSEIYLNLIPGDSTKTIPLFFRQNDIEFDFIEVDGSHKYEYCVQDIQNTAGRLRHNGILYVDDYKSVDLPILDVDQAVEYFNWSDHKTYYTDGVFWVEIQKINNMSKEQVNHPKHYGGENNPYEAIKVIDAWGLGFSLGNTVKYISRAGKKDSDKELQDLKKALWYLQHHINLLENKTKD